MVVISDSIHLGRDRVPESGVVPVPEILLGSLLLLRKITPLKPRWVNDFHQNHPGSKSIKSLPLSTLFHPSWRRSRRDRVVDHAATPSENAAGYPITFKPAVIPECNDLALRLLLVVRCCCSGYVRPRYEIPPCLLMMQSEFE